MMQPVDYLIIGHLTADLTPDGRRLGGTVSYAARVAHAFGLRVGVLTSAAKDEPLLAEIEPYAQLKVIEADSTSTFENIYGPDGRQQYIRGVAAFLSADDIPREWLSAPLVHLGPLTDEVDPNIVHHFPDATVLLTIQGWLRRWDDDGLVHFKPWHDETVLQAVDVVVFSEEDIREAPELEQDYVSTGGHVIVTRSEKGGTWYDNGRPVAYDTPDVEEQHPTGAGDIFAAALLSSLYRKKDDMRAAIDVAARLAAISVTRFALEGTPSPREVQQTLAKIGLTYDRPDSV